MAKLKQRKILEFEINPEIIGEGITQSEMQCWDNCPEKWYLGYNLMLSRRGKFSWHIAYGGWMHSAWEEFYSSGGKRWHVNPILRDKQFLSLETMSHYDYWSQLAVKQMEIYTSHYKGDFKFFRVNPKQVEVIVDLEWEGVRFKGMIDLFVESVAHGGFYVLDHKTTGRIDRQTVLGWDFRLQFLFYCWLAWKMWPKQPIHGYFVNAMKKPQIKQGESTLMAFLQRVQSDMMERPEKYFYRDRLRLKKGDLQHFEDRILRPKINRIKMLFDPDVPTLVKETFVRNQNTDYCIRYGSPCEFLPVCSKGLALEMHQYRRREVKHMELMEEGED